MGGGKKKSSSKASSAPAPKPPPLPPSPAEQAQMDAVRKYGAGGRQAFGQRIPSQRAFEDPTFDPAQGFPVDPTSQPGDPTDPNGGLPQLPILPWIPNSKRGRLVSNFFGGRLFDR